MCTSAPGPTPRLSPDFEEKLIIVCTSQGLPPEEYPGSLMRTSLRLHRAPCSPGSLARLRLVAEADLLAPPGGVAPPLSHRPLGRAGAPRLGCAPREPLGSYMERVNAVTASPTSCGVPRQGPIAQSMPRNRLVTRTQPEMSSQASQPSRGPRCHRPDFRRPSNHISSGD